MEKGDELGAKFETAQENMQSLYKRWSDLIACFLYSLVPKCVLHFAST